MAKSGEKTGGLFTRLMRGYYNMIAKHPQLFIVILTSIFSILTKYGSSFQAKQITASPGSPKRFFPLGSSVLDFPFGNIHPVSELITKGEVVFLMYYAPWCTMSKDVRPEFMKAAKYFEKRVRFIAVNCWWPDGQCRKNYKFLGFPELYLYHAGLDGYKYNGVPTADYMIRFIEDFLYPLKILHSAEEIREFISKQDNSIIGYFDFNASPQPPGYSQFYFAAMRLLENELLQPVRAALVTQEHLAWYVGLHNTTSFILKRTTNTSQIYPSSNNFTCSQITLWVQQNMQRPVVKWLSPPGVKSLLLSREIKRGPAVIVLAPMNQLNNHYYYDMVQEVMLNYLNCNNSQYMTTLITRSIQRRRRFIEDLRMQKKLCDKFQANIADIPHIHSSTDVKNCCVSLVTNHFGESRPESQKTICEYCTHNKYIPPSPAKRMDNPCSFGFLSSLSKEVTFFGSSPQSSQAPKCLNSVQFYNPNEYQTLCCKDCLLNRFTSDKCSSRKVTDPYIAQSPYFFQSAICKKLEMQYTQELFLPSSSDVLRWSKDGVKVKDFNGAVCATNKTLNLYVMDSTHHSMFFQHTFPGTRLNVKKPAVILIDNEREASYILKKEFSKAALAEFMMNFTNGKLQPFKRSEERHVPCYGEHMGLCIRDVTASTFQQVVMQENKDVMLLFYTPWCGFCSAFSHLFLRLAKYFSSAQSLVFARINADVNDLPWEFTVSSYPTLLFFPAHRKADSVAFPDNVPKALPNLIKFVLHHSTYDLRLDTAVDVCSKSCGDRNRVKIEKSMESLKVKHKKYQQRLRRQISKLSPVINRTSEPQCRTADASLPHSVHSSVQLLRRQIKKINKKLKDMILLHDFLLQHRDKYLSREKLINYFSVRLSKRDINV